LFDSLKYAKILEEAGIPRNHAETHIRVLGDVIGDEMATKQDLAIVGKDLSLRMGGLGTEFKTEISELRTDMDGLRTELKDEMLKLRDDLRSELKGGLNSLRLEFRSDLKEAIEKSENRMIIKMGSMMAAFLTLGLALSQMLSG